MPHRRYTRGLAGESSQNAWVERFERAHRTDVPEAWIVASLFEILAVTEWCLATSSTGWLWGSLDGVPPFASFPRPIAGQLSTNGWHP
jgi:hypothetical protein